MRNENRTSQQKARRMLQCWRSGAVVKSRVSVTRRFPCDPSSPDDRSYRLSGLSSWNPETWMRDLSCWQQLVCLLRLDLQTWARLFPQDSRWVSRNLLKSMRQTTHY